MLFDEVQLDAFISVSKTSLCGGDKMRVYASQLFNAVVKDGHLVAVYIGFTVGWL